MQRLIEQPAGDGDLLQGDVCLGRVHCHLAVYQHFSDQEGESVPAHFEIEGRITAIDDATAAEVHRVGAESTLRLTDGRLLDFLTLNDDGAIRSTGRGLYRPEP